MDGPCLLYTSDVYKRQQYILPDDQTVEILAGETVTVAMHNKLVPEVPTVPPVSYTHLDVYKRQLQLDPVLRFEPSFGVRSRHIGVALF